MVEELNVMIVGVGGQGVLSAAEVLATAAFNQGLNVRMSEIHGLAMRGGVVNCVVRIGSKVHGPMILEGRGHILLGLEPLETLRASKILGSESIVIFNSEPIIPLLSTVKGLKYPTLSEVMEGLGKLTKNLVVVNGIKLAKEAGDPVSLNMVMLGSLAAATKLPISLNKLKEAISECLGPAYIDLNLRAFDLGYRSVKDKLGNRSLKEMCGV